MTDDPIVQAAADALARRHGQQHVTAFAKDYRKMAKPVVRAVTPLIRRQIADEIEAQAHVTCDCKACESLREAARIARGNQR